MATDLDGGMDGWKDGLTVMQWGVAKVTGGMMTATTMTMMVMMMMMGIVMVMAYGDGDSGCSGDGGDGRGGVSNDKDTDEDMTTLAMSAMVAIMTRDMTTTMMATAMTTTMWQMESMRTSPPTLCVPLFVVSRGLVGALPGLLGLLHVLNYAVHILSLECQCNGDAKLHRVCRALAKGVALARDLQTPFLADGLDRQSLLFRGPAHTS
eukprot:845674-Lingulodinium_polyedra.AAC.1